MSAWLQSDGNGDRVEYRANIADLINGMCGVSSQTSLTEHAYESVREAELR